MSAPTDKGAALRPLVKPPITREQLRAYAEASLDDNPIHLDDAVARQAGLDGVIAHGMITMAFFGELMHQTMSELGRGRLSELTCRFKAMTKPGDVVTVGGAVRASTPAGVDYDLEARNQRGEVTATGFATIEF
jgi:acyl dehydratase